MAELPSMQALHYAAAVAQHGSFSAAARACGVSQPTISSAIAELEDELGATLFDRSRKPLGITPSGVRLLPAIKHVLDASAELARAADALTSPTRKLVRIGFTSLIGARRLAMLFEPFRRQAPDVELIYKECVQHDAEARLDANQLDFICGVGLARSQARTRQPLYNEALRYVPPNGAPHDAGDVTLHDVAATRLVLSVGACGLAPATRALFAHARIAICEYDGEAVSYSALEEWAELGIGGALIPESLIRRARSQPLVHNAKHVALSYEAVWRKDLLVAKHVIAFARYLKQVVPRLVVGAASLAVEPATTSRR